MTVYFTENPNTTMGVNLQEEIVQTGPGLAVFRKDSESSVEYRDGNVTFKPTFNGCELIHGPYNDTLDFVGVDITGAPWSVRVDTKDDRDRGGVLSEYILNVMRPSRQEITDLFRGRPFSEVVAAVLEEVREAEMNHLRKRAVKCAALEEVFAVIYEINKAGGPSSRAKVTAAIELIEPGLAVEKAA